MQVQSLGREHPLKKEIATHCSILAWRIPWTEGAWWVTRHGVAELDMTKNTHTHTHTQTRRLSS